MPGSGDSIQALKAGVMEIPDVIVVNKAEHPLTDTMVREVRTALSLGPSGDWKVPIIKTVGSEGEGIPELLEAIEAHRAHVEETGTLEQRRARNLRSEVLGLAAARMRRELEARIAEDREVAALLESVVRRETDPATAAARAARAQPQGAMAMAETVDTTAAGEAGSGFDLADARALRRRTSSRRSAAGTSAASRACSSTPRTARRPG